MAFNSLSFTQKKCISYPKKRLFYYKCNAGDIVNNKLANYADSTVVYDAVVNLATITNTVLRNNAPCLYFNNTQFQTATARPITSQWVIIPPVNTKTTGISINGFSVSLWIYPTDVSYRDGEPVFCMNTNNNTNTFYSVGIYGNRIELAINGMNFRPCIYVPYNWIHVVISQSSSRICTVYVNNVPYVFSRPIFNNLDEICDVNLGSYNIWNWLGMCDEVQMFNYPLSASEVTVLFSQ
jgi:hypothetical protein